MRRSGAWSLVCVALWACKPDDLRRDDCPDADADGRCDNVDLCLGEDISGDEDEDGVCDDRDVCAGGVDGADADGDGVPDACDD